MNPPRPLILLVEDNPNDVRLALHAFKQVNPDYQIQVVRDGVEALDYLFGLGAYAHLTAADKPTLILMDIKLPRVDGIEVLRVIKADERTRNIPVVMLTSSREERDIVESYRLGVNSYIVKPVDFDQFTQALGLLGKYWISLNNPPVSA